MQSDDQVNTNCLEDRIQSIQKTSLKKNEGDLDIDLESIDSITNLSVRRESTKFKLIDP